MIEFFILNLMMQIPEFIKKKQKSYKHIKFYQSRYLFPKIFVMTVDYYSVLIQIHRMGKEHQCFYPPDFEHIFLNVLDIFVLHPVIMVNIKLIIQIHWRTCVKWLWWLLSSLGLSPSPNWPPSWIKVPQWKREDKWHHLTIHSTNSEIIG